MTKSKSHNFIIELRVYPFQIMFSFGETDEELYENLITIGLSTQDSQEAIKCLEVSETTRGHYFMNEYNQSVIRLYKPPNTPIYAGVLQHEILHAVCQIMRRVGIPLKFKTEEVYTYLLQYITTEVYKQIK